MSLAISSSKAYSTVSLMSHVTENKCLFTFEKYYCDIAKGRRARGLESSAQFLKKSAPQSIYIAIETFEKLYLEIADGIERG